MRYRLPRPACIPRSRWRPPAGSTHTRPPISTRCSPGTGALQACGTACSARMCTHGTVSRRGTSGSARPGRPSCSMSGVFCPDAPRHMGLNKLVYRHSNARMDSALTTTADRYCRYTRRSLAVPVASAVRLSSGIASLLQPAYLSWLCSLMTCLQLCFHRVYQRGLRSVLALKRGHYLFVYRTGSDYVVYDHCVRLLSLPPQSGVGLLI